jgi:hypothetical protein
MKPKVLEWRGADGRLPRDPGLGGGSTFMSAFRLLRRKRYNVVSVYKKKKGETQRTCEKVPLLRWLVAHLRGTCQATTLHEERFPLKSHYSGVGFFNN